MRVTIDTKKVRACSRKGCSNPMPYYRHHLGNDGLLAKWGFTWARRTYHRYYSCREVCDDCHMAAHYLYDKLLPFNPKDIWPGTLKQVHKRFEAIRNRYIQIGKRFLNGDIEYPDVPPEYREKWRRSHSIWRVRRKSTQVHQPPSNPIKIRFDHE